MKKLLFLLLLTPLVLFSQTKDEIIEKINSENFMGAISDAKILIEQNPDDAYVYYLRGFSYRNIKNFFNAKKDYLKAFELGYSYEGAYKDLASIYFDEEDYSNAVVYYEKQLEKLGGDDIFAHYNIGISYYNASKFRSAIEYFTNVISINSDEEAVADAYDFRGKSKNNLEGQSGCSDIIKSINLHLDALLQKKRWGYSASIDYVYNSYCTDKRMYNFYFREWKKRSKWMFK